MSIKKGGIGERQNTVHNLRSLISVAKVKVRQGCWKLRNCSADNLLKPREIPFCSAILTLQAVIESYINTHKTSFSLSLSLSLSIYIYIYIYVSIYLYLCLYLYMYLYLSIAILSIYIYTYLSMSISIYIYIFIYISVSISDQPNTT